MNDNAKAWVEALRSGKYEQGRNRLRTDDSYCCLGVACEISGLGRWEFTDTGRGFYAYRDNNGYEVGCLPDAVMKWVGLETMAGDYSDGLGTHSLLILNDTGLSFEQIADIIESEPEGLFAK